MIRSCIFLSIIPDAADRQSAQIQAAEAIVQTAYVAVFLLTDLTLTPTLTLTLALTPDPVPSSN